jgi:hypothetical protein
MVDLRSSKPTQSHQDSERAAHMNHPTFPGVPDDVSERLHLGHISGVPPGVAKAVPHDTAMHVASVPAMPPVLSDADVDDICAGLKQNAAKARFLRDVLKVPVQRKPNGRPLVLRSDWERRNQTPQNGRIGSGPKRSKAS